MLQYCAAPGCPNTVKRGRCREHQRPSAVRRGYNSRWQRFREWFLSRHPNCEDCEAEGRWFMGTPKNPLEVHHKEKLIDHPELQYVESNCRTLCKTHHSKRTAKGQ